MKKLIIMIGLPGSGKSTIVRRIRALEDGEAAAPAIAVICPDEIREQLTGDAADQSMNAAVFATAYERTDRLIRDRSSILWDATNLKTAARKAIVDRLVRQNARDAYRVIYVYVRTDIKVCKERNKKRARRVPEEVIDRMSASVQNPEADTCWDYYLETTDGKEYRALVRDTLR